MPTTTDLTTWPVTGAAIHVSTRPEGAHRGQSYDGIVVGTFTFRSGPTLKARLWLRCSSDMDPVSLTTDDVADIIALTVRSAHPTSACPTCDENLWAAKAHAIVTGSRGCTYGEDEHRANWDRSALYVDGRYIG